MPRPAQDRMQKGPLSALLILLGLLLGSGTATAAGTGITAPATRAASGRQAPSAALVQPNLRDQQGEKASDGSGPGFASAASAIRTDRLWSRPGNRLQAASSALPPQSFSHHYQARAPPAA